MGDKSAIEWTDASWNPVTGCTKVSPGCKHCYAETQALRLKRMGLRNYRNGFKLTLQSHMLEKPLHWRRPRRIFVNSMSDLFHEGVDDDYVDQVFAVMALADQHTFQILTKRPGRQLRYITQGHPGGWTRAQRWQQKEDSIDPTSHVGMSIEFPLPNVWLGTSVEDRERAQERIHKLRATPAAIRFLSIEPLLGDVGELDLLGIHWVIVGGESGKGHRPMKKDWVCSIRDQCVKQEVPFFFKQWGGVKAKSGGRELDGRTWDEMPARNGKA